MLKLNTVNNQRCNGIDGYKVKIKEVSEDFKIFIGQKEKECKCDFLRLNKDIISLSKGSIIEKINAFEKRGELDLIQVMVFYSPQSPILNIYFKTII